MLANVKVGSIVRDKKHNTLWRCTAVHSGGLKAELLTLILKDNTIASTLFDMESAELDKIQPGQIWRSGDGLYEYHTHRIFIKSLRLRHKKGGPIKREWYSNWECSSFSIDALHRRVFFDKHIVDEYYLLKYYTLVGTC